MNRLGIESRSGVARGRRRTRTEPAKMVWGCAGRTLVVGDAKARIARALDDVSAEVVHAVLKKSCED